MVDKRKYFNGQSGSQQRAVCPEDLNKVIADLRSCGGSVIDLLEAIAPCDLITQMEVHFVLQEAFSQPSKQDELRLWQRYQSFHDRAKLRIGLEKIITQWSNGETKNFAMVKDIGKAIMPEVFGGGVGQGAKADAGAKVDELMGMFNDGSSEKEE